VEAAVFVKILCKKGSKMAEALAAAHEVYEAKRETGKLHVDGHRSATVACQILATITTEKKKIMENKGEKGTQISKKDLEELLEAAKGCTEPKKGVEWLSYASARKLRTQANAGGCILDYAVRGDAPIAGTGMQAVLKKAALILGEGKELMGPAPPGPLIREMGQEAKGKGKGI
jgi:hypothetical protein